MLLEDRVAIVSGVGPGMGRDIALTLAREGAHVVLGARTEAKLAEVAAEVSAIGRRAPYRPTDVTSGRDCAELVALARDELGRVDVLVNNAFVQPPFETLEDAPMSTWESSFDINLFGAVRMTTAALPVMRQQRSGSIIFVSSMSARRSQPYFGVYSAAKAALLSVAQVLAREVGPDRIRVNSVVPGYIWGPSVEWYFEEQARQRGCTPREVYDEVAAQTCLRYLPSSAEIADSVLFFASDLSRVVTGQSLDVNAGHWLH